MYLTLHRYGDSAEKQDLLPQYNEDKKPTGVVLGADGEIDLAKQQQLDDIRKKLSAVKQNAYHNITINLLLLLLLILFYLFDSIKLRLGGTLTSYTCCGLLYNRRNGQVQKTRKEEEEEDLHKKEGDSL